jgi:hypothetical protein
MNPIRAIRRLTGTLAGVAVAFVAVPAALASASPGQARALSWADPPLPPGWNKHPPLPAHVHALAAGGLPGWQITLIAAVSLLAAAALMVAGYRVRAVRRRVTVGAA